MTEDKLDELLTEAAKEFYKSGLLWLDASFTYVELGCPYNGEMNPLHISLSYVNNVRPTEEKEWKYEKE